MQANLVKSLVFCSFNLFLQLSINNYYNCYCFILFNALRCTLIYVFIDHMYALLVRHSIKLTAPKVNDLHTFMHWLNGNVIH